MNETTVNETTINDKPNTWVATALGFFLTPLGMLYVAQPTWAAVFFAANWMIQLQYGRTPWPLPVEVLLDLAICGVGARQAYRFAVQYPADKPRPRYSRWYALVGIPVVVAAVLIGVPYALYLAAKASCVGATCG